MAARTNLEGEFFLFSLLREAWFALRDNLEFFYSPIVSMKSVILCSDVSAVLYFIIGGLWSNIFY